MNKGKIVHHCEEEQLEFRQQLHLVIVCELSVQERVVQRFVNNRQLEEVSNLLYSSFFSTNNIVCSPQYREDIPWPAFKVRQSTEQVLLLETEYYSLGTFVLRRDRQVASIRL